jgi:hypothetical protein
VGSDKFRLAVSADGSSFFDGLIVDNANGIVDQPRLPRFKIPWAGGRRPAR